MAKRHERIKLYASANIYVLPPPPRPLESVQADRAQLGHNNTYGPLPLFYVDRPFVCRDCGESQVWTAKQQKWWYEIAKGHINSVAIRCRPCRKKE